MRTREYEDKEYWNNLRGSREHLGYELLVLDGCDGEQEFDDELLKTVEGNDVLDLGCGIGPFALEVAKSARKVYAVDFSEEAVIRAKTNLTAAKQRNAGFELADARELPFAEDAFHVVISRRGPETANMTTLSEADRVLRKGGSLMEITIGEQDKTKIFGRGQKFGVQENVAISKGKTLRDAGFRLVKIRTT